MKENLPQRKRTRLAHYDYSAPGAYFVTVCVQSRKPLLSAIVGGGAHDAPRVVLTQMGKIVEGVLLDSQKISGVRIDQYVLMPDHLHVIVFIDPPLDENTGGTSRAPSPTNKRLSHVIATFKRLCARKIGYNPFQRSFYDHVIRDRADYEEHEKYIRENPMRRFFQENNPEKALL